MESNYNQINSVCCDGESRSEKQVKKKWIDYSSFVKNKESKRRAEHRRTGGGKKPDELVDIELKTVEILGETAISGNHLLDRFKIKNFYFILIKV